MLDIVKISIIVFIFWICGETGGIFNFYFKLIEGLPAWLNKPLGGCVRCMSGQVLFHYYWITHLHNYNIVDQLFYPAAGIFLAIIYTYLYELTQN
jgi:hypothetical protein